MSNDAVRPPDPVDERRRASPLEWWYLEAMSDDGSVGVATELLVDSRDGRARFWFVVSFDDNQDDRSAPGRGRAQRSDSADGPATSDRVVVVVANDVAVPITSLEARTSGLWFEYRSQADLGQFTVDLEAFGLEVDAGAHIDETTYGHRIAVGCELEWITPDPASSAIDVDSGGYGLEARVEGLVLVGPDTFTMTGSGRRYHRWGTADIDEIAGPTNRRDDLVASRSVVSIVGSGDAVVRFDRDPNGRWGRNRVERETVR